MKFPKPEWNFVSFKKMKIFNQKRSIWKWNLKMKIENENLFLFPFLFSIYIIPLRNEFCQQKLFRLSNRRNENENEIYVRESLTFTQKSRTRSPQSITTWSPRTPPWLAGCASIKTRHSTRKFRFCYSLSTKRFHWIRPNYNYFFIKSQVFFKKFTNL